MSRPIKRSFTIGVHRTSISLEAPFWEALKAAAAQEGMSSSNLIGRIDVERGSSGLSSAVNNYNNFVSSFESRSLVTARKFRDLNIEPTRREIELLQAVEALPRHAEGEGAEIVPLHGAGDDNEDSPQIAAE